MSGAVAGALVPWAVEALAASALLIALVLLVRGPVRRTFGAPVAYALWALPVLRLALPPLPHGLRESVAAPLAAPFAASFAAPLTEVGQQVTIFIAPAAAGGAAASPGLTAGMTLALLWGAGAAAFLGWHLVAYARFRQRLLHGATLLDRVGGVHVVASAAAAGPLAFGIAKRYVAFPRDFAARYDADERDLALAHELGHHARGDLVANWIALAVLALHWFNPLAWYAFRAFRADQEMANDARVLARLGEGARHAYACAIVKAAHGGAIAAACHLHTVDDLKGRLKMLGMSRISRGRALAGLGAIAASGAAALALTASGTQAAERMRASVETAAKAAIPQVVPAIVDPAAIAPAEDVRVVIERDGKRTEIKGAAAEAWIAANPVPAPPAPPFPPAPPAPNMPAVPSVPPVPPTPPTPPVAPFHATAAADAHVLVNVPEVRSARCAGALEEPVVERDKAGGHRRITICTDRIERRAARAQVTAIHAAQAQRLAMSSARQAMHSARRAIIDNRHLSTEDREHALEELDAEIERMEDGPDDHH
jgi:beta-lactamase regulating signal transducer with metallopeptidase domain